MQVFSEAAIRDYEVANLVARDALVVKPGDRVFVVDASADATVVSGWAIYRWDGGSYEKIQEQGSLEPYVLPVAGVALGGVLSGGGIAVDGSGNVSINDDSHNHIIGNVAGLQPALDGKEGTITAGTTAQYYRGDKTFQTLDKAAVGLPNVDDTSDLSKPVSTATQTALGGKEGVIVAGTVAQYYRGDKTFQTLDKAAVGLPNVDNTSDLDKPISTATQTALDGKEGTITVGTSAQYYRGDKTFQTLDKAAVGLPNVDNTSDIGKPISTATQTALDGKEGTIAAGTSAQYYRGDKTFQTLDKAAVGLPNVQNVDTTDAANITSGVLDANRLPSYVDDVLEYADLASFPVTGETGKIYVALDTNKTYRWSGSTYVFITSGAVDSVAGKTGVVTLVKADVGLTNVDNTSDLNKPVSTATQTALDGKEGTIAAGTAGQYYRGDKTFQTLDKVAVGLLNVDNTSDLSKPISTATQTALDGKEDTIVAGTAGQYYRGDKTFQALNKISVGLSNVDDTSDLSKPISTATQTALDGKEDGIVVGTTTQYYRGDKTFQELTKAAVGLANVDNTSDIGKPISTATQIALDGKEDTIASGTIAQYYRGDKTFQTLDKAAVGLSNVQNVDTTNAANITSGVLDASRLPSYVDDVLEYADLASFPVTGEAGKIYVALDTNKTYRWSGSTYVFITSGAVDSVAGKTGVVTLVKADVGLTNVDNTSDLNKPVSTATQLALGGKEDAFSKNTAFNKNFGTLSGTVVEGDDSRVTNAFQKTTDTLDDILAGGSNKHFTSSDELKLDGVEVGADVTDASNVAASGAVMDSDFSSNGIMARLSSGGYASRTITGTAGQITVADGDGVSGNPTLNLPSIITIQSTDDVALNLIADTDNVGELGNPYIYFSQDADNVSGVVGFVGASGFSPRHEDTYAGTLENALLIGKRAGFNQQYDYLQFGVNDTVMMTISMDRVGIGTNTPASSAKLDISSTTGALLLPRMTTVQRDALTAVNGMVIYNTTTNAFNFYENGGWVTK